MKKSRQPFFTPWRIAILACLVLIIAGLGTFLLLDGKNIAVLNPRGIVADKEKDLIIFTVLLGSVVVVPVFIMLFAFAWKYREGNTKAAKYTPEADGNRVIEVIWWGIPLIIIGVLSVVTWTSTHDLDPYKALESDKEAVSIQVVALQWKWLFMYPEQGIATVNEVRFPEDTPVNFTITADAPMSAFWIPNLGTQTYAMNGMSSQLSLQAHETGEYRGSNTNINGEGYSEMDFKAISTTRQEFDLWTKAVAGSDKHLDWTTYEQLARPSKDQPVVYYMLHQPKLYDMIRGKYMDMNSASSSKDSSGTMNHEGMH
ncbi:MAG: Ubiquinol oxidase subunit 2 [Candidatus Saccharibacteria bacterium]|nr:Ubiquinol oxidase subunit 2 [Candidatus Saccharibacteria bacterium]